MDTLMSSHSQNSYLVKPMSAVRSMSLSGVPSSEMKQWLLYSWVTSLRIRAGKLCLKSKSVSKGVQVSLY